jgi:homoserine/homoserine lactone efflux protein
MSIEILFLFIVTTAMACFTPGPAAMFVASVGTAREARLVAHAIGGIALANAFYFGLSALGLAGLLLASPEVYAAIRWAGAAYLIYLGVRLVLARGGAGFATLGGGAVSLAARRVFGRALVLELSNPKALLYFAALLPQFVTPEAPLAMQFLGFCLITVVLDVCAYSFYGAIGFGVARFSAPGVLVSIRRVAGAAFVLAGVRLVAVS